ncbi:hypothetical protein HDV00_002667 [Rhizophlyctis rosea]|nr:hypothetical protein HDV00_002667 [Rhizophlyctis rosea]
MTSHSAADTDLVLNTLSTPPPASDNLALIEEDIFDVDTLLHLLTETNAELRTTAEALEGERVTNQTLSSQLSLLNPQLKEHNILAENAATLLHNEKNTLAEQVDEQSNLQFQPAKEHSTDITTLTQKLHLAIETATNAQTELQFTRTNLSDLDSQNALLRSREREHISQLESYRLKYKTAETEIERAKNRAERAERERDEAMKREATLRGLMTQLEGVVEELKAGGKVVEEQRDRNDIGRLEAEVRRLKKENEELRKEKRVLQDTVTKQLVKLTEVEGGGFDDDDDDDISITPDGHSSHSKAAPTRSPPHPKMQQKSRRPSRPISLSSTSHTSLDTDITMTDITPPTTSPNPSPSPSPAAPPTTKSGRRSSIRSFSSSVTTPTPREATRLLPRSATKAVEETGTDDQGVKKRGRPLGRKDSVPRKKRKDGDGDVDGSVVAVEEDRKVMVRSDARETKVRRQDGGNVGKVDVAVKLPEKLHIQTLLKTSTLLSPTYVSALMSHPDFPSLLNLSTSTRALEDVWQNLPPDAPVPKIEPTPPIEFPEGWTLDGIDVLEGREREVVLFCWVLGVVGWEKGILEGVLEWICGRVLVGVGREGWNECVRRMTRAHTLLCRFARDIQRCRVFVYDLLREVGGVDSEFEDIVRTLVGDVKTVWSDVLNDGTDDLARVMRGVCGGEEWVGEWLREMVGKVAEGGGVGVGEEEKFTLLKATELAAQYVPWEECYDHLQTLYPHVIEDPTSLTTRIFAAMARDGMRAKGERENMEWFRERVEEMLVEVFVGGDEETRRAQEGLVGIMIEWSGGEEGKLRGVRRWVKGRGGVEGVGDGVREGLRAVDVVV